MIYALDLDEEEESYLENDDREFEAPNVRRTPSSGLGRARHSCCTGPRMPYIMGIDIRRMTHNVTTDA